MKQSKAVGNIACATVLVACSIGALAQSLPAGVEGTWRITGQQPKKDRALTGTCASGPVHVDRSLKGTKVQLSNQQIDWGNYTAQNPAPAVHTLDTADFMQQYLRGGVTMQQLGLAGAAKVEVIQLGAPGTLPFDAIVVKDPSTIYFTRCGLFTEAVHAGGFVAPRLPEPQ